MRLAIITSLLSVRQANKLSRPPRQGFEFAPASVDGMKLDEAFSHLRAAAVIYADAQADELRRYLWDEACDKRKLFVTSI